MWIFVGGCEFISGDGNSGLHGRTLTASRGTNADACCPRIVTDEVFVSGVNVLQ